jgi:hypothetical protein
MQRIGLTFEEVVELKTRHLLQLTPAAASSQLQARGYDCRPEMLELLIEDGVVKPAGANAWSQADVDAAAEYFEDCGIFTPYAAMCQTLGCRYADFERPLREAAKRETGKYGRQIPADDQYFVMHRQPPRGDAPAIITFSLCDDIQDRLERGEEV